MEKLDPDLVLYLDNHLIAVHKPAGLPVQADDTGDISLFEMTKQYVKEKFNKPGRVYLGMVHRIDRPVTGLVLFARTDKAASRLSAMFRDHKLEKTYLAIIENKPPRENDSLVHYLSRNAKENRSYAFDREKPDTKRAELSYNLVRESGRIYMLEVNPLTGRHHQIRAQLARMGCPIMGDVKYGASSVMEDRSIGLLARRLSLMHPVQKTPLVINSHLPSGPMWNKFDLRDL
ncbi:MAG: RNA pseudouridine synthase [Bacteroidota bacterium]|nr:RNA pseudouridine synthase [Bacteroidota bacterium]